MSRANNTVLFSAPANFVLGPNCAAAANPSTSTSFPIVSNLEVNSGTDRAANQRIPMTQAESALRGPRKNSHIMEEMALELQQQGVHFTAGEIKSKMHNLSQRYRKEKTAVGSTGGSPSQWPFYERMRAVFSPYVSYNTEGLVEESFQSSTTSKALQISVKTAASSSFVATSPLPSPACSPSPSAMMISPTDTSSLTISFSESNIKQNWKN
ncbi:uncharacterized protein LOC120779532 [Bactrocera tryoni]|uniref:uncharacterized protein LOC120779532 n=1 Tax=Bactrocera tryoni TaxID=59916 RepID=UPI001A9715DD|nr:uncharacterized protein LOC120779532 [Bactrocera tryoni]